MLLNQLIRLFTAVFFSKAGMIMLSQINFLPIFFGDNVDGKIMAIIMVGLCRGLWR